MYLKNKLINELNGSKAIMFVDMDGVIADYDFGRPLDFKNKRPLKSNIDKLREISELSNIELHILSVCRKDFQIKEKNEWLDIYAPFFKKENRVIISKESNSNKKSCELKANYLKEFVLNHKDFKVILIDDDNEVLQTVNLEVNSIILYQDSSLVD